MAAIYNAQLDAFELHHLIQEQPSSSRASGNRKAIFEALGHALSGSIGSAISNVATYPLDLIITRLQIQRQLRKHRDQGSDGEYHGLVDASEKIYNNEGGLTGFYTGIRADTVKTLVDAFLFFLLYTFLRNRRLRRLNASGLNAIEELGVGFCAGAVTKLATTPVAQVVTRTQTAAMTGGEKKGWKEVLQEVEREKGWPGFWSGYQASLVLTLNPSITFFLFEMLKRTTLPGSQRETPHPAVTFLLGAVSKAVASSVTYPFSLAKSRLQADSGQQASEEEDQTVIKDVHAPNAEKKVVRETIFSTVLNIIDREGVQSLYEGLHLEITKGFFSHGITMAVKQFLHAFLTRAAYLLSIVGARYRRKISGKRMRERAKENVEYYNLAMARAGERIEDAVEQGAKEVRQRANETAEFVAEYVEEGGEEWKELYGVHGLARWLENRNK